MTSLTEKMARAICELRIREVRRFDWTPEEIEQKISASVDYAWGGWVPEATAALSVALEAIGEDCAEVAADAWWAHKAEDTPALIRARIAEMKRDLSQPA